MDYHEADDEWLLSAAANGDRDAFATFYRRWLPPVTRYHLRRTQARELARGFQDLEDQLLDAIERRVPRRAAQSTVIVLATSSAIVLALAAVAIVALGHGLPVRPGVPRRAREHPGEAERDDAVGPRSAPPSRDPGRPAPVDVLPRRCR